MRTLRAATAIAIAAACLLATTCAAKSSPGPTLVGGSRAERARLAHLAAGLGTNAIREIRLLEGENATRLNRGTAPPFLRVVVGAASQTTLTFPLWQQALLLGAYEDTAPPAQRAVGAATIYRIDGGRDRLWATVPLGRSVVPTHGGYTVARLRRLIRRNAASARLELKSLRIMQGVYPAAVLTVASRLTKARLIHRQGRVLNTLQRGLVIDPEATMIDGLFVSLQARDGTVVLRFGYAVRLGTAYSWRMPT